MTGMQVTQALERARAERGGLPTSIMVDNGTEFCSLQSRHVGFRFAALRFLLLYFKFSVLRLFALCRVMLMQKSCGYTAFEAREGTLHSASGSRTAPTYRYLRQWR
jgi:hypothetical protein